MKSKIKEEVKEAFDNLIWSIVKRYLKEHRAEFEGFVFDECKRSKKLIKPIIDEREFRQLGEKFYNKMHKRV